MNRILGKLIIFLLMLNNLALFAQKEHFDVKDKERSEIENLYRLYETTVLYQGC